MKRKQVLLIAWLVLPFVVVGALWFAIDRHASRPDAEALRRRAMDPTADPAEIERQAELARGEGEASAAGPTASGGSAADAAAPGRVRRIRVADPSRRPTDLRVWSPSGVDTDNAPRRSLPVLYVFSGQDVFSGESRPDDWPAPVWGVDAALGAGVAAGELGPVLVVGVPVSRGLRPAAEEAAWLSDRVVRAVEAAFPAARRDVGGRAVVGAGERTVAAIEAGSLGAFGTVLVLDGVVPSGEALGGVSGEERPRAAVVASASPRSEGSVRLRGWFEGRGVVCQFVPPPATPTQRGRWLADVLANPLVEVFTAPPASSDDAGVGGT